MDASYHGRHSVECPILLIGGYFDYEKLQTMLDSGHQATKDEPFHPRPAAVLGAETRNCGAAAVEDG